METNKEVANKIYMKTASLRFTVYTQLSLYEALEVCPFSGRTRSVTTRPRSVKTLAQFKKLL